MLLSEPPVPQALAPTSACGTGSCLPPDLPALPWGALLPAGRGTGSSRGFFPSSQQEVRGLGVQHLVCRPHAL